MMVRSVVSGSRVMVVLAVVVAMLLAMSVPPVQVARAADPACGPVVGGVHQVSTAAQLQAVGSGGAGTGECRLGASYRQTANITLTGAFTPIGGPDAPDTFTGVYDGGGNSIAGLSISSTSGGIGVGLFSFLDGATVKNLTIEDATVSVTGGSGGVDIGILAGLADNGALIEDVSVSGSVTGTMLVGGLTGRAGDDGLVQIRRVSAVVTVSGDREVGGLVGQVGGGSTIEDSSVSGSVVATGSNVGGLVGDLLGSSSIVRSTAAMTVVGLGAVGGLVGDAASNTSITTSFAVGSVEGRNYVGGLVGESDADIEASFALSNVTGTEEYVGGLIGALYGGTISDVYARGAVGGDQDVGGLIGLFCGGSLQRSYATGPVGDVVGLGKTNGGLVGGVCFLPIAVPASFWDISTTGLLTSEESSGATGLATAAMTSFATFGSAGAEWPIVEGWAAYAPDETPSRVWGICSQANDGYPFLLWEYDADPCVDAPVTGTSGPSVALACSPSVVSVGGTVTCVVSGGPVDFDFVWRAAYNPVFAEGVVRTGGDGSGSFTFVVPRAALGSEVTVELVAWLAPSPIGVAAPAAGGVPLPSRIDAGGGPVPLVPLTSALLLAALLAVLVLVDGGREAAAVGAQVQRASLSLRTRRRRLTGFDALDTRVRDLRARAGRPH